MPTQDAPSNHPASIVKLPMSSRAPALARVHVVGVCRAVGLDDERTDTVMLVVSELVTNAVKHVGTGMVTLEWIKRDDQLLIGVGDDAPHRSLCIDSSTDTNSEHGRGLRLVMTLARQLVVLRGDGFAGQAAQKIIRVAFDCPERIEPVNRNHLAHGVGVDSHAGTAEAFRFSRLQSGDRIQVA
ncbi:ATP-binding protein [Embleya sp. NPDC020630]|uniref:ATP-binding protein n=1 Tax=Embleya sp. NPDC020630 TaxID=3363979 RepID=UPI0037B2CB12